MFHVNKAKNVQTLILGVFSLLIIIVGLHIWFTTKSLLRIEDGYQAVFLTNGQVYFGEIVKQNRHEVYLTHVYYLQVQQPLQDTPNQGKDIPVQPDLSLVKLGNELHAPKDAMFINRDHIVFIENLKDDSKVVKAIESHQQTQ